MGRLRLGAIAVATWCALAGPAGGSEITSIASSAEPQKPFELRVQLRWDRVQERATITRERSVSTAIEDAEELRYSRTMNAVVPRVTVGLYRDLELHFELPYVLADDHAWRFGVVGADSIPNAPGGSTITTNTINASGETCTASPCALFPVAPTTTAYHGGRAGDLKVGLGWGIFNDKKDDTKPYWLVGVDVTFPTASLYEPAADRGTGWQSPYSVPAKPGPFGDKVWKYDLYTVMSRRIGPIDPYFKAHVTAMTKSSETYSNCKYAEQLAARGEMNAAAPANCKDSSWTDDAGAKLPWIAGVTFGTEVVPFEDNLEQQRVALDFRLFADYTSSQRFYNELTDASGKLHQTEGYLTMGGFLGLYLRASRYVSLHATASLATETSHLLTGESLGKDGAWPTLSTTDPTGITADPTQMNPNFDWRYDAPGHRFRISEVSLFAIGVAGVLTF